MSGGDLGVSAFVDGESIFTWIGTVEGGKGTLYEGLSYKLSLRFALNYPFKHPQVKFETMCFIQTLTSLGTFVWTSFRTSGLQAMVAELFFCLFKVYWKRQTPEPL